MNRSATKRRARATRPPIDKIDVRRRQLAGAALKTLAKLGYAKTSLREIAQRSPFSHGSLHYYFEDKVDLITCCVKQYKADCVQRYDEIVVSAKTAKQLCDGFAAGMARTLADDAPMHRLWYDLRNQSLFEAAFRADVFEIDQSLERMIWRIVSQYAELGGASVTVAPSAAYAIFDGLFQQALLRHVAGEKTAANELEAGVAKVLAGLVTRIP
jgi:AcrR family transcriptional regulator